MPLIPHENDHNGHQYAASHAVNMLSAAIRAHNARTSGGLRALAKKLGIKQATVLSHMANGRMPIPLERAPQLAMELQMDVGAFCRAVLAQRFPSVSEVLEQAMAARSTNLSPSLRRLELMLEGEEAISDDRLDIIAEVLRDKDPSQRWLRIEEIAAVSMLRKLRPEGLTVFDQAMVWATLSPARENSAP